MRAASPDRNRGSLDGASRIRGLDGVLALALVVCLLAVVGCGTDSDEPAVTSESIVEKTVAPVLTPEEVGRAPAGSPERAFLSFWSSLQYASWPTALSFYDDRLVRAVGTTRFIAALRAQASYFRGAKPKVVQTSAAGGRRIVRFQVPGFDGKPTTTSIAWRRAGLGWRIAYDSQLDTILQSYAQGQVQAQIDPGAERLSPRAIRAGAEAAQIQARVMEPPPAGG